MFLQHLHRCTSSNEDNIPFKIALKAIQLIKINPLTGVQTSTIYSCTGTITATSVNEKKQIAFSSSTNIGVVDTSGNVIASISGLFNYCNIKPYKKNYYLFDANKKTIELRDLL